MAAMDLGMFDALVGLAALEAREPGRAHWAVGFAEEVESRSNWLMEAGRLACFTQISVGVGLRRVPAHEDALFKDGTGLVMARRGDPWEARELALRALREHGEAWICVKMGARSFGLGVSSVWACAAAREEDAGNFEPFWARMAMEIARAEVRAVAELGSRGYCRERSTQIEALRAGAWAALEGSGLAKAIPEPEGDPDGPARL